MFYGCLITIDVPKRRESSKIGSLVVPSKGPVLELMFSDMPDKLELISAIEHMDKNGIRPAVDTPADFYAAANLVWNDNYKKINLEGAKYFEVSNNFATISAQLVDVFPVTRNRKELKA